MIKIDLFIPGLPISKLRERTDLRFKADGTPFIVHRPPDKLLAYEKLVRDYGKLKAQGMNRLITGACEFKAVFHYPVPESYSRRQKEMLYGTYKTSAPDIDNAAKSVLDGLNRQPIKEKKKVIGWDYVFWTDDALVVRSLTAKKYIEAPDCPVGVSITITEL